MGLICRMVVMEDAIKEIISTTKPVIISSPAKARHRLSTESEAQTVNTAPQDQQLMAEGCKDALLVMIDSEPNGQGYTKPEYLNWTNN